MVAISVTQQTNETKIVMSVTFRDEQQSHLSPWLPGAPCSLAPLRALWRRTNYVALAMTAPQKTAAWRILPLTRNHRRHDCCAPETTVKCILIRALGLLFVLKPSQGVSP